MELVSGPDVGSGLLFQLTADGAGAARTYTVHVQDAGLDAAAAPPASPERAGFRPASEMCPIGGRRCWHRAFAPDREAAGEVRFAYHRLRYVLGPILAQRAGARPVPFATGIDETIGRVAPALAARGIPWLVGGSAAAALRGVEIAPGDADLLTTADGVDAIAEALGPYLIEPAGRDPAPDRSPRRGARAFVGTLQDGLAVEWAEALPDPGGEALRLEWTRATLAAPATAERGGHRVPVAPLEFALARAALLDRRDRVAALRRHLGAGPGVDAGRRERLAALVRPVDRPRFDAAFAGLPEARGDGRPVEA